MSCCGTIGTDRAAPPDRTRDSVDLLVPDVHCAGCISRIEGAVLKVAHVRAARLNLTTRRLTVQFDEAATPDAVIAAVESQGYACRAFDHAQSGQSAEGREGRVLLRSMALAGFAAGNVMLLSVSVWSGADGSTRDLFHWISALIALPVIAVAGQPFFRSAWQALRMMQLNMDVPISLAIVLAGILSLSATLKGGEEAFFDAAVMLLFFLLVGRYLDHRVRAQARSAVSRLLSLWSSEATRITGNQTERVSLERIAVRDLLLVAAGERMPVDGEVVRGTADLDCAIVTGEAEPVAVHPGDRVRAGTMVLTHPLTIRATAVGEDTFLAQVVRLMEGAEKARGRHVRLADRAARLYAPVVHLVSALTFAGWMIAGASWGEALWVAVSVLIITCPCALGLAVPAVQVVASGALFRAGIFLKDGSALERLAVIDRAVFDKTGTVTLGTPRVTDCSLSDRHRAMAAALARNSRHPLSVALADHVGASDLQATDVAEHPGLGLSGKVEGTDVRLGKWAFVQDNERDVPARGPELFLSVGGNLCGQIGFEDALRPEAAETISEFTRQGHHPVLLSGDQPASVERTATCAGFADWQAEVSPAGKIAAVQAMTDDGRRVLMVGDGINDAPALAAAHVSMAPAGASDVGRAAADLVFTGDSLAAVAMARRIAVRARRLILQNFGLALAYNLVAIPVAVMGGASPLVAAIAMSSSSIIVTLNALRLRIGTRRKAVPERLARLQEAPA